MYSGDQINIQQYNTNHFQGWWNLLNKYPPVGLLIPSLFIILLMIAPVIYLLIRGFENPGNLIDILTNNKTAIILLKSLLLVITVTITCLLITIPLSWILTRSSMPFRKSFFILCTLPLVIPSYVGAFIIISLSSRSGMLFPVLNTLGVDQIPKIHGLVGSTIVISLLSYPYLLLPMCAAMAKLNPLMEEAARSLGKNHLTTFLKVTLPQLKPAIFSGALLICLYTLSDFGAVSLMRYETFTWAIFQHFNTSIDRSMAANLSLVLLLVATIIIFMQIRYRGNKSYHHTGSGAQRNNLSIRLGKLNLLALFFCSSIVIVSIIFPIGTLIYWVIKAMINNQSFYLNWSYTWNSLMVSSIGAALIMLFAVPSATLIVRHPNKFTKFFEFTSYFGYLLPGIVVALSILYFCINYFDFIYQSLLILILGYAILFFPAALISTRDMIIRISPNIEESAKLLGANTYHTLTKITLPLMLPGIITGTALVFLITIKELPLTLILGPLDFHTLATTIWDRTNEAFFAQSAVYSLILIGISVIPLLLLSKEMNPLRDE